MSITVRYILFYHPKEVDNVEDIDRICRSIGCELLVVPRGGLEDSVCSVAKCVDLDEALKIVSGCMIIALETSGKLVDTLNFPTSGCASIVLGAEDYGIPSHILSLLRSKGAIVVRLPMSRYGVSYNVVTSLVMLLTDLSIRARGIAIR